LEKDILWAPDAADLLKRDGHPEYTGLNRNASSSSVMHRITQSKSTNKQRATRFMLT
jgi:hypothetical protein